MTEAMSRAGRRHTSETAQPDRLRAAAFDLYNAVLDSLPIVGDGRATPYDDIIVAVSGPMARLALLGFDAERAALSESEAKP